MHNYQLAIIGAMDEEIALLISKINHRTEIVRAGITFYSGTFHDKKIVACKTGVGKVNAAVVAQICIDYFQIKKIIFTGVAGALDPQLEIGDVVISTECMHHDMDVTALGFARGQIPFHSQYIFVADTSLRQLAKDAGLKLSQSRIFEGRILSGDQFIAKREQVEVLYHTLCGMCTEMEGASVAQVCAMNQIPFVVIRSMSDKADGSAHINFAEFSYQASQNSFFIVDDMVKHL